MKHCKIIVCLILAFSLCCTAGIAAYAEEGVATETVYQNYTTVFVHGLCGWGAEDGVDSVTPYWGMTSGSMMDYLGSHGYSVVSASVGPFSSCWDRCCELYAQLTGTKTDYGEAHIAKVNAEFDEDGVTLTHERFGRDYTGNALIQNWGPGIDNKINLVGHSFGGPTVVMFLHLLAEGNEAERNYAKQTYGEEHWKEHCSPLFWGDYDGENLVHSVTSLAGVLNGTTFIDCCPNTTDLMMSLMVAFGNVIGNTALNSFYDMQLEQFGITKSENPDYTYTLDILRATSFFDSKDNAIYDLSIEGCNTLKAGWECYDNVFYFAYAGCTTTQDVLTGNHIPNANTWLPLMPFAAFMGSYTNENETVTDIYGNAVCTIDSAWLSNDGMVNTITASYVFGCPHKDCDGTVQPGLWITMPAYGFDHMDYCGGMLEPTQNTSQCCALFDEVMQNILESYAYATQLASPVVNASVVGRFLSKKAYLCWDAVDGADTYRIYRASSADGCYRLLATVSDTAWTDYRAMYGGIYYYRITAVNSENESVTSDFSEVRAVRIR